MREVLASEGAERREQRQARGVDHRLPLRKLQRVVRGLVHEFVHADVVLHFSFRHEVPQLFPCSCFNGLEDLSQGVKAGRNLQRPIFKPNRVGGVEANEVHFLVHVGSKILEIAFKYIGHPIPARTHVKRESVHFKLPSSAAQRVVSFHNAYAVPSFGQVARGGETGEASSEDQNLVSG